jgi:hypothetical protein
MADPDLIIPWRDAILECMALHKVDFRTATSKVARASQLFGLSELMQQKIVALDDILSQKQEELVVLSSYSMMYGNGGSHNGNGGYSISS